MWTPVDTRFYFKYHPVAIAAIGGADAEYARQLLEQLGSVVLLHSIGTPGDFLQVIAQGAEVAPHLVICGHGDEGGLVFGEYAPGIDTSMLVAGNLPPACIAEHVNLPGCVVINTACFAGRPPMAEAFMKSRLKAYVGAVEEVPFYAEPLFLAHFFYQLFHAGCSEREAWERAASYDANSRVYVFYDEEGCHTVA